MAAQAVVVGVLMVVVFLTLLRPEGNGPLFGVGVPREPDHAALPSPGSYHAARDHRHGGRPGSGPRPGTVDTGAAPVAGETTTAGPATVGGAAPAPSANGGDGGGQGSPTDDQYTDTLTRLAALLN